MSDEGVTWQSDAFFRAIASWVQGAERAMRDGVVAGSEVVAIEAQNSFASGDGPQSQSGDLAGSIHATPPEQSDLHGYVARIGPAGLEYARKVELGKSGDHHGPAYPYLRPGFERAKPQIMPRLRDLWANAHKG